MKNAYLEFFKLFPKDKFFQFGIDNIIAIDTDKAKVEWNKLKGRIHC